MRKIYEVSWQVVVWLGPAAEHTSTAFGAISWLAKEMKTETRLAEFWARNKLNYAVVTPISIDTYPMFPWQPEVFLALRGFIAQNYWHRLWILQEPAMAQLDAPVLWGGYSLTLGDIYTVARLIESLETEMGQHMTSPGGGWNESKIGLLKNRRLHDGRGCPERQWKLLLHISGMRRTESNVVKSEKQESQTQQVDSEVLIETLYLSRGAGASEPRDKVYGLLGLPTIDATVGPSSLATDYNLELSKVYVNFTRAILARGDLNCLRFVHSPVGDVLVKWKQKGWSNLWVPLPIPTFETVTPTAHISFCLGPSAVFASRRSPRSCRGITTPI
ncbi:heterokaryon incompatibility protein-domain-containing protein [Apiospora saccharicola]|uniref:Heterokaryon incompatibility protein-domain-containing protein n=1 Tax=Apiospora saccharicola TaxID=335842 RepID=A0ABR1UYP6_9PEZI